MTIKLTCKQVQASKKKEGAPLLCRCGQQLSFHSHEEKVKKNLLWKKKYFRVVEYEVLGLPMPRTIYTVQGRFFSYLILSNPKTCLKPFSMGITILTTTYNQVWMEGEEKKHTKK